MNLVNNKKRKLVFIWPLNKKKLKDINYNLYQYNQIEKLKYFSKYFSEMYEFEFFNQIDFEKEIPSIDYNTDIVLAHSPPKNANVVFTEIGLKNYLNVLVNAKHLYLLHPGSPYNYRLVTEFEKQIVQNCQHFICWCGKYWYEKMLQSPSEEDNLIGLIGLDKISRLEPAIAANMIDFRPIFKPEMLSFLHVSNISLVKAMHRIFLSIPREKSKLYIASEYFANHNSLTQNHQYSKHEEKIKVSFSNPLIYGFDGTTHELTASVITGNSIKNVSFHAMGFVKNWESRYINFMEQNINYYLHLSFSEGLSASVLEAAARGILPCVNVDSGFLAPSVCYLTNDPIANQEILGSLASISEREYLQRVTALREFVLSEHCWEKTLKVLENIFNKS